MLYGERLGLLLDYIDPEAQHFIDCISLMFKTTSPMLYIPPALLRQVGAKVWRDHVEAWDGIFNQGTTQETTTITYMSLFWVISFLSFINQFLFFTTTIIWGVSGPLHSKHLQALTSGDWPVKGISWCLGKPAPAGQAVH